jgi:hypothetical protein
MNIFLPKHLEFLSDLLHADLSFILVGGYAVIYHGYVRGTGDMDIWLKPDNDTKEKLLILLEKHGVTKESIRQVKKLDFTGTVAFHFGELPERIDFLTKLTGIHFNDALLHAEKYQLKDLEIRVLHVNDLVINKLLTNRTKDKADVEELQKIQRLRDKRKRK